MAEQNPPPTPKPAAPASQPNAQRGVTTRPVVGQNRGKQVVTPANVAAAQAAAVIQKASAPKAPPFRIHSIGSYTRWLKMLVYGEPGEGKTRLVASSCLLPAMQSVLFIDCEAGDTTIATLQEDPEFWEAIESHVRIVRIQDYKTLARVHEFLKVHCRFRDRTDAEAEKNLKTMERNTFAAEDYDPNAPPMRFYTVCMDSLSEAETFSMNDLLGIDDTLALDQEESEQTWTEFRKNRNNITRLVREFRNLPMNMLMTCAADTISIKVGDSVRVSYKPMLTGKMAKQLQGFFDVVGFLETANGRDKANQPILIRRMHVRRTPRFDAKCRFSSFQRPYWDNPEVPTILQDVGLIRAPTDKVTQQQELTPTTAEENLPNTDPPPEAAGPGPDC